MIHDMRLENYRGFRDYRLDRLARVNLLVGKNNGGKTSILEAVQILASQGDPSILSKIAMQRGETVTLGDDDEEENQYVDISHFFHGSEFPIGSFFRIETRNDLGSLKLRVAEWKEEEVKLREYIRMFYRDWRWKNRLSKGRHILGEQGNLVPILRENNQDRSFPPFLVTTEGAMLPTGELMLRWGESESLKTVPVRFIGTESLKADSLGRLWDQAVVEGRESGAIEALHILEPKLSTLFFLGSGPRRARNQVLAGFDDPQRSRVPLGNFGEGMRRLLSLALALNVPKGGIVLIDEIDTGLHYSIMGDMWLLVVNAALQNDVQIFATTHSLDCLRGLAWLCKHHPDLTGEVSVQKIEPSLNEAVAFDAEDIQVAAEQSIEVR